MIPIAEKDITSKTLESYNDVFADIVNGFLFNGEEVIKENELTPADSHSQYKAEEKIHEQERDSSKFWNHAGIKIALIGLENQVKPDKAMPIRVLSYDGAAYRSQVKSKNEIYYPVITLVLYFGKENWNYGKSLHDCLKIPPKLLPFVNDYKMNFYAMKDLDNEQIAKFHSDFKIIAEFFKALNGEEKYHPTDQKLEHPEEVLDMISVFSGDNKFRNEYNALTDETKERGISMCSIYDQIKQEGNAEGEEKGIAKGEVIGIAKGEAILLKKLEKLGNTAKQLAAMFEMPESEVERLLAMDI